jgi:DNA methylase
VDGCRIVSTVEDRAASERSMSGARAWRRAHQEGAATIDVGNGEMVMNPAGRWPANVVLDEEAAAMLDEQSGNVRSSGQFARGSRHVGTKDGPASIPIDGNTGSMYSDSGGASRFFYCAKASNRERHGGLPPKGNKHPTCKPVNLMRWLVRLITPPGGLVLDPFAGSGTTGIAAELEGFDFIGIERELEYVRVAEARIAHWSESQVQGNRAPES